MRLCGLLRRNSGRIADLLGADAAFGHRAGLVCIAVVVVERIQLRGILRHKQNHFDIMLIVIVGIVSSPTGQIVIGILTERVFFLQILREII